MYEIAEEPIGPALEEAKGLLEKHWREIALNQHDIPLDPDYTVYEALAQAGMIACYTVRSEGALVGYAVYIVKRHPHYRNHKWAIADLFWVDPDYRDGRIGDALFDFIEDSLRAKGVHVMHTTVKVAHPAPGFLLRRRGHVKIEEGYSKRLN